MCERNYTLGSFPAAISSPGDALRLAMETSSIVKMVNFRRILHAQNPANSLLYNIMRQSVFVK